MEAELVFQSGVPPQARYLFKHALVQDTAYQSLLKSRRQQLHQQVAQVLEEQFPEIVESQPELVAHHYTEAGLIAQAIPYWQRAGERASQRSANAEAISHLTKGLELLKTLPDTPERAQQELTLQIALGVSLMATKGYAAPEVEELTPGRGSCASRWGRLLSSSPVLRDCGFSICTRPELQTARELAEQLSEAGPERYKTRLSSCEAHYALGSTLFFLGELALPESTWSRASPSMIPQQHRSHSRPATGEDPGMYLPLLCWPGLCGCWAIRTRP